MSKCIISGDILPKRDISHFTSLFYLSANSVNLIPQNSTVTLYY